MENYEKNNKTIEQEVEKHKDSIEIEKKNDILIDDDIDNEKESKLKDIIFNCLGVLYSLKQNGEVVLKENKFIKNLWSHVAENNQDEFHQINDILLNLTIKNKI